MTSIDVDVSRWSGGWELAIGGVPATQAGSLDDAAQQVRDYLGTLEDGVDPDRLTIRLVVAPTHSSDACGSGQLVETACAIATAAHLGQTDKLGADYIRHPERVAARVAHLGAHITAAAWLHDVIEDSATSAEDLRAAGIPDDVVDAVLLLTRTSDTPSATYYERIRTSPLALQVKLADIADNLDPRRLAQLDAETQLRLVQKYAAALTALTGPLPEGVDARA